MQSPHSSERAGLERGAASPLPAVLTEPPPSPAQRLVLGNDFAELRRMSAWLADTARAWGLPAERIGELDLCANEAVTNIISYAYDAAGRRQIIVSMQWQDNGVRFSIEDDGRPYNPLAVAPEPLPATLAEARIGGLGVRLILGIATDCGYRREDGRNVLSFTVRA